MYYIKCNGKCQLKVRGNTKTANVAIKVIYKYIENLWNICQEVVTKLALTKSDMLSRFLY